MVPRGKNDDGPLNTLLGVNIFQYLLKECGFTQ